MRTPSTVPAALFVALTFLWIAFANAEPPAHALAPVIQKTKAALAHIDANIKDYSSKFVKRERVNGILLAPEYITTKVRNTPLSVYMHFDAPATKKGQEVLYVAGANDGKMFAHLGGRLAGLLPTLRIDPEGGHGMRDNRYPITDFGIRRLCVRLIEIMERDAKLGDCEVKSFKDAKVAGRMCHCFQVRNLTRDAQMNFHIARVYFDQELNIPIRYEAYGWPNRAGGKSPMLEEYTYTDLKLNRGFTDSDFDEKNAAYGFK